jgi:ATP-dependent DNA helicase DinG
LVASVSFWEGFDVPGDALQMLVIDKLPFPPPDDPWVKAQSEVLIRRGSDPFDALFMPAAAMALRQGTGRLIRSESDHGLLVIGDTRLGSRSYGRRLISALPSMPVMTSKAEALQRLKALVTRASTTARPPS